MSHILRRSLLLAAVLGIPAGSSAQSLPIDLGTLGGNYSIAVAVNARGDVVGSSDVVAGSGESHAFLWTETDGMIDLGTLGGSQSGARAVSATGQVVGASFIAGNREVHAFSWTRAGGMVDLGTLGGTESEAWAVNAAGQVVGWSRLAGDDTLHAFLWTQAGGMVDLGTLGGSSSQANALNEDGQVVGMARLANGNRHAFSWTQSGGMQDLGTVAGGAESGAWAVNAAGQVVGYSYVSGYGAEHAMSWTQTGGMVDLGTLGGSYGVAWAVNDKGEVAGTSRLAGDAGQHAFLWSEADGTRDLGTLGGVFSDPYTVNGRSMVVGESSGAGNNWSHAFLWRPAGGMVDLGTLGGESSVAVAANDDVDIVGVSVLAGSPYRYHATLWKVAIVDAVSAAPSSGSGSAQAFTMQYTDSRGAGDIQSARIRFAVGNAGAGSCTARYNALTRMVQLQTDDGSSWTPPLPIGSGTIANSQCTVNLAGSSATPSDDQLTLVLDIVFSSSFAGLKSIYLLTKSSVDSSASTGWMERGTWSIPAPEMAAVGLTPNTGTGVRQAFTLEYSDSAGAAADLASARVRFASSTDGRTCTVRYNAMTGAVGLLDDTGATWLPGRIGSGTLANSQCTLHLASSAATSSGPTLTLVLDITFRGTFAGAMTASMMAKSAGGVTTGWVTRGTWTVPVLLEAVAVTPNAGTGLMQAFTLQYTDLLGATDDLSSARVRFAGSGDARSCTVRYNAMTGAVGLLDDTGTTWLPGTIGSGTLANGQCTLLLASSAATASGPTLTLVLDIIFSGTFAGAKTISMIANSAGGDTTGWVTRGAWTVPLPVVDAISVTPSSGAGTTQLFVLAYADSGGVATDLTSARVRFAGAAGGPCVIDYNAMTNRVRMQNNAGAWKPFVPFGSGTLGNRQCTLDLAASSATRSGTDLTLMLQIAFSATFAGEKNIAMRAASHAGPTTGWMDRGTWTVPSASSTISVRGRGPSLNPATFELSDPSHGR